MADPTPFERNILEQPAALLQLAEADEPDLSRLRERDFDRIILTGMGSSLLASMPTWRTLVQRGEAAWMVDTATLLSCPQLVTDRTALIVTSQSGASGEIVELVRRTAHGDLAPKVTVGVTNLPGSPLAQAANVLVPLHSGAEATVSTKSFLNSLAAHHQITAALTGSRQTSDWIRGAGARLDKVTLSPTPTDFASPVGGWSNRRVAYIGWGDEVAIAKYAALITKEAAKIPAEGFVAGQFRHGPLEMAGEDLTAVLFDLQGGGGTSARRLTADLADTGAHVLVAGASDVPRVAATGPLADSPLSALIVGALLAQQVCIALARANHVEPGTFIYGQKVTTVL